MASANAITLTETSLGSTFELMVKQIYNVQASGTGSVVMYSKEGAARYKVTVDESLVAIQALADKLITVTVDSVSNLLNANYVIDVTDDPSGGTGSKILYSLDGATTYAFFPSETKAVVKGLINTADAVS